MEKELENSVIKPELSIRINDEDQRLISTESELEMDSYIYEFKEFISSNNGTGKTDEEIDRLYASAQLYIVSLRNKLRDSKLNFYFNRKQYQFLTSLLLQKMEYDVDTVFVAMELKELLLGMREVKFLNDKEIKSSEMTPTEITYLYHLISKHKVKGLTDDSYSFANVLRRIGEVSKIINYYDTTMKGLVSELTTWIVGLGGGELLDELSDDSVQTIALQSNTHDESKESIETETVTEESKP